MDRTSSLNEQLKDVNIIKIPDSEQERYIVEEKDNKTNEELNEGKEEEKNYNKTQFSYNKDDDEIEIIGYKGNAKDIIIPAKIDNYEVTKVNLSGISKNIDSVYIPNCVKEIEGKIEPIYSNKNNLIIVNVIAILALIVYVISIATLSNKNLEENFYNSTTYIFSVIYLLVASASCFLYMKYNFIHNIFFILIAGITAIYLLLIYSLRLYKEKLKKNK